MSISSFPHIVKFYNKGDNGYQLFSGKGHSGIPISDVIGASVSSSIRDGRRTRMEPAGSVCGDFFRREMTARISPWAKEKRTVVGGFPGTNWGQLFSTSPRAVTHCLKPLAPGEGFPTFVGTGWLIPKTFGTLPTGNKKFNILSGLLRLDLFLPFHSLGTCIKVLAVNTYPRPHIALSMF